MLMYLANPCTASRAPAYAPGASGVSTSAITAIRISVGVTPISEALVCSSAAAAGSTEVAEVTEAAQNATATPTARRRSFTARFPLDECKLSNMCTLMCTDITNTGGAQCPAPATIQP